jgi:arsenite methyltransferase
MPGVSLQLDTLDLAEYYEQISQNRQFKLGQTLIAALAPQPGAQVLDIGAGTGLLAEYVAGLIGAEGHVTGIDPLPLRIELAKRKARANLAFAVGDALDLGGFAAGQFDIVYLNAVFHWIADKPEALRQIFRVLKPGGRLGISTGSKDHPNLIQGIKAKVLARAPFAAHPEGRGGGPRRVSAAELSALFTAAGFTVERVDINPNFHFHGTAAAAIEFSQASSFGNFLGHLPEELRTLARRGIETELEALRTGEGIRFEGARLLGIAVKPEI